MPSATMTERLTGLKLIVAAKKHSSDCFGLRKERLWRLIEDLETARFMSTGQVEARNAHWRSEALDLESQLWEFIRADYCSGK